MRKPRGERAYPFCFENAGIRPKALRHMQDARACKFYERSNRHRAFSSAVQYREADLKIEYLLDYGIEILLLVFAVINRREWNLVSTIATFSPKLYLDRLIDSIKFPFVKLLSCNAVSSSLAARKIIVK